MIWEFGKKLKNPSDLDTIESEWGVLLPKKLKDIVIEHDHASPPNNRNIFKTKLGDERCFGGFCYFNLEESGNVISDYNAIRNRLPDKVFPFAEDPGGNFICLDYKVLNVAGEPQVVFWNHEYKIEGLESGEETYETVVVSASFEEFLNNLYGRETNEDFDLSEFEVFD